MKPTSIKCLITERDNEDPFSSTGALIHEMPANISKEDLEYKARILSRYGQVYIGHIDIYETVEEHFKQRTIVNADHLLVDEVREKLGQELLNKLPFDIQAEIPF